MCLNCSENVWWRWVNGAFHGSRDIWHRESWLAAATSCHASSSCAAKGGRWNHLDPRFAKRNSERVSSRPPKQRVAVRGADGGWREHRGDLKMFSPKSEGPASLTRYRQPWGLSAKCICTSIQETDTPCWHQTASLATVTDRRAWKGCGKWKATIWQWRWVFHPLS